MIKRISVAAVSLLAALTTLLAPQISAAANPTPALAAVDHNMGKVLTPPRPDPKRDKLVVPSAAMRQALRDGRIKPPAVPEAKRSACAPPCYFYAGRSRVASNVSAIGVNTSIITGSIDASDYHTLWEVTAQSGNGAVGTDCNIIEVGANRDRVVNGDTYPALTTHVFTSAWYCDASGNRVFCGYNSGCGYTDYGANLLDAGDDITAANNTQKQFQIIHDDTTHTWWTAYDGNFLGYFPDGLTHSMTFTRSTKSQTFDELASSHNPTCGDMGNSWLADSTKTFPQTGQQVFSYNDDSATSGTLALAAYTGTTTTLATKWNVSTISNYSYYSGGPGYSPNPSACP